MQTISLVFLVRPKSHSAGAVFIQQNEPHETNFLLPLSQLPENPCCYSTGQFCSPLQTARASNRFPALVRSSVEPFFGISNFGQKRQNVLFLGRCCSATGAPIHAALLLPSLSSYRGLPDMQTISLVFLVRPKSHSAGAVFIQQNEPHETNFLLPLSQLPENPCCYSTGQCCSPLQTARARNRFPALVRSSVEPLFGISNFGQKRQNAPFLGRCCSATGAPINAALLLPSLSS